MSPTLEERLIFIPLVTGIFALLSFGFMFLVGGGTRRVRSLGLCSTLFIAGTGYCMSWRKELTTIIGWQHAWMGATVLVALGSAYLCKTLLASKPTSIANDIDKS
jgi:hypothetical protein